MKKERKEGKEEEKNEGEERNNIIDYKFLSVKSIASAVSIIPSFFFFDGRGKVPGLMITSCLSTKEIMLPKFLDIDSQEEQTALCAALITETPFLNIYF